MDIIKELGNDVVSIKLDFEPSEQGGSFLDEYQFSRNGRTDQELITLAWKEYYNTFYAEIFNQFDDANN